MPRPRVGTGTGAARGLGGQSRPPHPISNAKADHPLGAEVGYYFSFRRLIYFDTDLISPPFFVNSFLVKPGSTSPAILFFSSQLLSGRDDYSVSLPSWHGAQTGDSAGSGRGT